VTELWTVDRAADYWQVSPSRARAILAGRGIKRTSGYPADQIRAVTLRQGARTDLSTAAPASSESDERKDGVNGTHAAMTTTQDKAATEQSTWLAGIYEKNFDHEAWLGWSVLGRGTTRFPSKDAAGAALRIRFDGDSLVTADPETVQRARAGLAREELLNSRHRPGSLSLFVRHAPHLDGAGLMTFILSDSMRSVEVMIGALVPASDAGEARTRLVAAAAQAAANPERDAAEDFMEKAFGMTPHPAGPQADRAVAALETLTDDFRGFWDTYVGNTCIGVVHSDCWAPASKIAMRLASARRRITGRP